MPYIPQSTVPIYIENSDTSYLSYVKINNKSTSVTLTQRICWNKSKKNNTAHYTTSRYIKYKMYKS